MSASLRSLSDHELLICVCELAKKERKLTLSVLIHLNEIERRKLHLKQGHGTMFDYCTAGLGYSASAAMRRIQAARCIALFPDVHELLAVNRVNLSTVCLVSKVLTHDNKAAVLARISGKSQREVETIVAEFEPLSAVPRDRVRTVVVRVPAESVVAANYRNGNEAGGEVMGVAASCEASSSNALAEPDTHTNEYCRNGSEPAAPGPPALQRRAMIQFSASEGFLAKVERVRSLASHRLLGSGSFEQVFELLMDCFIQKEAPELRQERREARGNTREKKSTPTSRSIPVTVRDEIFVRDNGRCSYVGTNGKRCESQQALQVDHIRPVARGGPGTVDNLRLLCARHNRLEAERLMGPVGSVRRPRAR